LLTAAQQAQFQVSDLAFSAKLKSDALSGLVTLGYKVTPDVLVYGTYSHGSKSGGLNITAGGASRPVVNPEKVDAFEIGVKSQFLDNKLTVNAAAFYTEIRDYQANVSEQIPGTTASNQYIANIPKVRSQGVEADVSYAPSRWVSLTASGAYTDAKFISYKNAPQRPELAIPGTLQVQDCRARSFRRLEVHLLARYRRSAPGSETLEVYGHADYMHRSSFNSNATNSIYSVVPGYGLHQRALGLRTQDGLYDFSFWARNLANEDYYLSRRRAPSG
jgi:iron complex outermembrane receptor protein